MPAFPRITHVIYDMDGLLLDTEGFYTQVTQRIVGRFGKTFDWSVKSKMIGRKALDSAEFLVKALALPITAQQYLQEREAMLDELFPLAAPMPGAERLTLHLHSQGIPQAIASSSARRAFALKASQHQAWFQIFQTVVLGDDPAVKQSKPAPDIFLVAAQRLGADPAHCLVFEDAPAGMEAALAAGMSVVVVPDPQMERAVYLPAHQILNSLEEFEPKAWQLPAWS